MSESEKLKITFLGTGTSHGIPVLGCLCSVCSSKNKKNNRYRSSVLLTWAGKNILIDTPPELRLQLLREKISSIDAILFTHCHADHVYGLDDVRIFSHQNKIPVYGEANTIKELKTIFPYVFKRTPKGGGKPAIKLNSINRAFELWGKRVEPLKIFHGNKLVFGYRIDNFAYITDCSRIPKATFKQLDNLEVVVVDATRKRPHPTHFSLEEAIDVAIKLKAEKSYFTHISHSIEHFSDSVNLRKNHKIAYDGLKIKLKR